VKLTLDTCTVIAGLQKGDQDVLDLVRLALEHAADIAVTPWTTPEVEADANEVRREQTLCLLRALPRVPEPPADTEADVAAIVGSIHQPNWQGQPRASTITDARHLAAHRAAGRAAFVTSDGMLLRAAERLRRDQQIECLSVEQALGRVRASATVATGPADGYLRPYAAADEGAVSRLLVPPLAPLYPRFEAWLAPVLEDVVRGAARAHLGEVGGEVHGVCIARRKPARPRVTKISTLYVSPTYQRSGLGHHLLQAELRLCARDRQREVYTTVAEEVAGVSVPFFREHGFAVRGLERDRYRSGATEFVLAKAFAYGTVSLAEEPHFLTSDLPSGVDREIALHNLQRELWPLEFARLRDRALVIPVHRHWADMLMVYPSRQLPLLTPTAHTEVRLRLGARNTYYRSPSHWNVLRPGRTALLHVTGGVGIVGETRIISALPFYPEVAVAQFGTQGALTLEQVRDCAETRGRYAGQVQCIQFEGFEPYEHPVRVADIRAVVPAMNFQTVYAISGEQLDELRQRGHPLWMP